MEEHASSWTLTDAKARFSEVVTRALVEGPQTVTRSGHIAVVVVSADQWQRRLRRQDDLPAFLASSPLAGSGLEVQRLQDGPRPVDL